VSQHPASESSFPIEEGQPKPIRKITEKAQLCPRAAGASGLGKTPNSDDAYITSYTWRSCSTIWLQVKSFSVRARAA
jgi:hypothetical protein